MAGLRQRPTRTGGTRQFVRARGPAGVREWTDNRPPEVALAEAERIEREVAEHTRVAELLGDDDRSRLLKERRRPIVEVLDEFVDDLVGGGCKAVYARGRGREVRRAAEACGWRTLSDMKPRPALTHLRGITAEGKSHKTHNNRSGALRQFGRWCVREGRLARNPLENLPILNVELDRRRVRGPFTEDELGVLVADVREHAGDEGPTRAAAYVLAATIGLRRGELAELRAGDFALLAEPPVVRLRATTTKNRQTAELPLSAGLVGVLGPVLERARWRGGPVFRLPEYRTAKILHADMAAARGRWIARVGDGEERTRREASDFLCVHDERGRVRDFHSLRVTAATRLVRAGVHPSVTQRLLRHACFATTMKHYICLEAADLVGAVERVGGVGDGVVGGVVVGVGNV